VYDDTKTPVEAGNLVNLKGNVDKQAIISNVHMADPFHLSLLQAVTSPPVAVPNMEPCQLQAIHSTFYKLDTKQGTFQTHYTIHGELICSLSIWPHNLPSAIMVHFTILHGVIHSTVGTFIIVTMLLNMATIESKNSHIMFLNTQLGLGLSKTIRVGICGQTHEISFDRLALGVTTHVMQWQTSTQNCHSS
jgi:hypothetical protein